MADHLNGIGAGGAKPGAPRPDPDKERHALDEGDDEQPDHEGRRRRPLIDR
ncbi:hypothetical protein [Actinocrinis sp.]|uniref:hypothetical protein n=1 Tax=Actinocrinis sp. TaxID=1920516 RepID=UPI002DDD495C|nr:hypothetical protein [Actinocrinis sp.]